MNPTDIMRKLLNDLYFIAPEEVEWKLAKVEIAMKKVEKIFYSQLHTEAAQESIQVLTMLKAYKTDLQQTSHQDR